MTNLEIKRGAYDGGCLRDDYTDNKYTDNN